MAVDKSYWYPLHGNYDPLPMSSVNAMSARLHVLSTLISEQRAQILEMAVRANLGRAHEIVSRKSNSDDEDTDVRDATGVVLAIVRKRRSGHRVSFTLEQVAEPSFIFA